MSTGSWPDNVLKAAGARPRRSPPPAPGIFKTIALQGITTCTRNNTFGSVLEPRANRMSNQLTRLTRPNPDKVPQTRCPRQGAQTRCPDKVPRQGAQTRCPDKVPGACKTGAEIEHLQPLQPLQIFEPFIAHPCPRQIESTQTFETLQVFQPSVTDLRSDFPRTKESLEPLRLST
jgi:hypothetical protein